MLLDWDMVAAAVAAYVRENHSDQPRGALRIRYAAAGLAFVGLFGNDASAGDAVRREFDLLQRRLREHNLEMLGFGVSADDRAWALLVKTSGHNTEVALNDLAAILDVMAGEPGMPIVDPIA